MILSTIVTASLAFSGAFEAPATEGAPVATPTVEEVVLQPINAETAVAFKAKRVYLGDGNHVDDGIVLVQDGVIHSVGADVAVPKGVSVIELDGVLTPAFIAQNA